MGVHCHNKKMGEYTYYNKKMGIHCHMCVAYMYLIVSQNYLPKLRAFYGSVCVLSSQFALTRIETNRTYLFVVTINNYFKMT